MGGLQFTLFRDPLFMDSRNVPIWRVYGSVEKERYVHGSGGRGRENGSWRFQGVPKYRRSSVKVTLLSFCTKWISSSKMLYFAKSGHIPFLTIFSKSI